MINSIEIRNFLSHKHTKLELSPGVNVIVGPTDSGKSAIIRALKWVIINRPSGNSIRSNWGGETKVKIIVDDNKWVGRRRNDKENMYLLEAQQFLAIKTDVPEEIRQILNLNETNLQTQFESHFLLSQSPGEVAIHFNKVAHLDKIDIGLRNINRWLKEVQQSLNSDDIRLGELVDNYQEFDDVKKIEKKVKKLERIEENINDLTIGFSTISTSLVDLEFVELKIGKKSQIIKAEELVDQILNYEQKIKYTATQHHSLWILVKNITTTQDNIKELEDVVEIEEQIDDLLVLEKELAELCYNEKFKLEPLIFEVSVITRNIKDKELHLEKLEKEFHDQLGSGKICPLCGSII